MWGLEKSVPKVRGQHNAGYEEKRSELLVRARDRLIRNDGKYPSLREIAAACEVTLPTLRHYFGGRDEIVTAVLEQAQREGSRFIPLMRTPGGPFPESIRRAVFGYITGLRMGLADIISLGLSEGLREPMLGQRFLDMVLDPAVAATKERLDRHVELGEMRRCDTRTAALALVSPILLALLHQNQLRGAEHWPLDVEAFARDHAEAFVRAYQADG